MSVPPTYKVAETPVRFPAFDGYSLGGVVFAPVGCEEIPTAVVFNCGGGIAAARYARFAAFLASHGIPTLIYDYRGIGSSRPPKLRGFHAVAEDWSELDCGGAIQFLRSKYPVAELVGASHSIGALVMGGAPNIAEIARFVLLGPHTGYYFDYLPRYRWVMAIIWHVVMPALTRVFGYFPAGVLRLGEDIPYGVALQWAARRSPDLRPEATTKNARRARAMIARYSQVRGPALAIGFRDDAFATEVGMRRLLSAFPRLQTDLRLIAPAEVGMPAIGHFGFFRRDAEESLWPIVLNYLWLLRQERVRSPPGAS